MSPSDPELIHARRIAELSASGDWAGLARYWLAHQLRPALEAAVAVARRSAARTGPALAEFLESVLREPIDPQRELSEKVLTACDPEGQATLFLLVLFPRLALCELATQFPPERREQLLRIGLQAAEQACQVAAMLQDRAVAACCRGFQARGYVESGQREAARKSYEEARDLYRQDAERLPTASLAEQQTCWSNIGRLLLTDAPDLGWPDRHKARAALREARACAEKIRGQFLDPAQRQRVQGEAIHVYELLVQTSVDIWAVYNDLDALREAVEVAEASRARKLMEMLADEALDPAGAPPDLTEKFRTLRRRLRQARQRLQDEESRPEVPSQRDSPDEPPSGPGSGTKGRAPARRDVDLLQALERLPRSQQRLAYLREMIEKLEQEEREKLQAIHKYDPEFDPDLPVPPIDFTAVQKLLPVDVPTAVVQYSLTAERGLALVVTRDGVEAVNLPKLSHREAIDLALAWYRAYYDHRGRWDDAIPALLEPVAERAVRPVMERLAGRGIERLILSPNRALHLFPLHACRLADGRYLADACEVVYTPSLSILHRCAGRQRPLRDHLLLVENPTADLPFTEVEGAQLRRHYPAPRHTRRHGNRASKERLLHDAPTCHVFNYTGHAFFDLDNALQSGLVLGDKKDREQWLTLRDIFCALHLPQNRLTVINGCESGMIRPDHVDELVGLPSGFLYAGATCVLCTLWKVYDLSSALLVSRFHQEWLGNNPADPDSGRSVAAALREAQRWLREDIVSGPYLRQAILPELLKGLDSVSLRQVCERQAEFHAEKYPNSPPFASPVHWAAFVAVGLAYPLPGARDS